MDVGHQFILALVSSQNNMSDAHEQKVKIRIRKSNKDKKIKKRALTEWLSWLEDCPNIPRLWVHSVGKWVQTGSQKVRVGLEVAHWLFQEAPFISLCK